MSSIKSDITIVGGGLIGSALALWLAKHTDYSIVLLERNSFLTRPNELNQRVVALGALATSFLDDIGVLAKLDGDCSHPYQRMFVWDENSDGELAFDADSISRPYLGHMVDSQLCSHYLQQAVIDSRVECYFDSVATDMHLNGSIVSIATQYDSIESRLVVAADGSRSWVRQKAKIFANHFGYEQRGIVAKIETQKSHQDCAWQCFLSSGPVAILPLANNQSSIVWSAENAIANDLLSMSDGDFSSALCRALQGRLGAVKLLSKRQAFPLASLRAQTYFKRNVALVGDAAHSVHPLAGQGANLGFKDISALGDLLAGAEPSELGSLKVLSAYQGKRQADNNQTDSLMSALNHVYKNDSPILAFARGVGMNAINRSDVMRAVLARQAMGL